MVDFEKMRMFVVVAENENMSNAAVELNITQPALSKIISRIEDDLGFKLFDRKGRSIKLNLRGKLFAEYCRKVLDQYEESVERIANIEDDYFEPVRLVTTFPNGDLTYISRCVDRFLQKFPKVPYQERRMLPNEALRSLQRGEADIVISDSVAAPNLDQCELVGFAVGVVLSKKNSLADRAILELADLRREPFVCTITCGVSDFDLTRRMCQSAGFSPHVVFSGDYERKIGSLIADNRGISLMGEGIFERWREDEGASQYWADEIVFRPLSDAACRLNFSLSVLKGRQLTLPARYLLRELIAEQTGLDQI